MICSTRSHQAFVRRAQFFGIAVVVCLVVWATTGADYFWPGWVVLGVAIHLSLAARRVYGRTG